MAENIARKTSARSRRDLLRSDHAVAGSAWSQKIRMKQPCFWRGEKKKSPKWEGDLGGSSLCVANIFLFHITCYIFVQKCCICCITFVQSERGIFLINLL